MSTPSFKEYQVASPDFDSTRDQYRLLHERLANADSAYACREVIVEWDQLLRKIKEWSTLTYIRFHQDTTNERYKTEQERLDAIGSKFTDLETEFKRAVLACPFRKELESDLTPQLFAIWECNGKSFRSEIEADVAAEAKLQSEYTALTAGAEIPFRGETYTISEMHQFADDADREVRESGCRANSQWFADNASELDRIYDEQVVLRHAMAQKLGYKNFTELGYLRMTRIGYGPDEVATFRDQVRDEVVPLAVALAEKQAKELSVDPLMFWDTSMHSSTGNPKPQGDHDWMVQRAREMFSEMGHGLSEFFEEMLARGTMDLKSRSGKAGGGFCDFLHVYEFPFIFANFNGTRHDVDVFTHEMGHAFQAYSSRDQPMSDIVWPTTEACEIHSMGLEFLTWPYMDKFYGEEAADELRRVHLTTFLQFLPYGVSVDHFQHLVYDKPEASVEERNAMWQQVEDTYLPWYRYADLPSESSGRLWQHKQHLYGCPFYYIDYCLALTGALQFWSLSRRDLDQALDAYAKLCKLGGSQSYSELLQSSGLRSPFEKGCLSQVIAEAEAFLD